ncbi:MAG: sensor domain-containing diguanylate cyclase [Candidatus Omnitrophica bacterium]|nr:sensor domain-containing diguanylate cyclase [Candidatus Omnitrophota bacterium]
MVWLFVIVFHLPLLKQNISISHQLLAPHLFISNLILILAWVFSGPLMAVVLTVGAILAMFYVALVTKEPVFVLQAFFYGVIFVGTLSYLHRVQRKIGDERIAKEKWAEDVHLLETEIEKKESLKKALQHKIDRFLGLQDFSEELKDAQTPEAAAGKIVREACRVMEKADECALYLVDESRQGLALAAGFSRMGGVIKEKEGTIFDRWVMKRGHSIVIEDARSDFRFAADETAASNRLPAVCASPLLTERKIIGVLRAGAYCPKNFSGDDLRFLDVLSSLGAVTLKNLLLVAKTTELAVRDSLTGLYLKRRFEERLSEELARMRHHQTSFSLLMMDIDFFKKINDEYGHSAGDLVLKNVASLIRQSVGPADLAARYGGEEFVVLLPGKAGAEALELAEGIRREVQAGRFHFRRVEANVTVSLGVASFPRDGRTAEELLRVADARLYQAKHSGRNRVCGAI